MDILIDLLLFAIAFYVLRGRTYGILLLAAVGNILIYPLTYSDSIAIPATLNFIALMALISYGDKHYGYQVGLLFIALTCLSLPLTHLDLTIILITVAQLLGAGYGIALVVSERIRSRVSPNRVFDYRFYQAGE